MRKFIAGIIVGVVGLAAGIYVYVNRGFFDMRADQPAGLAERLYTMDAMDRYADRQAPKAQNPFQPTDADLIEGIRLYQQHCAVCHGGSDKPTSALGEGLSPHAPQFLKEKEAPDMPENQNYWIIKHGIRMTGMPGWEKLLSDDDIWKLTTFLGKMEHLDRLSPAVQAAWKTGGQAEIGAQPVPAVPENPAPAAAAEGHHHHHRQRQ